MRYLLLLLMCFQLASCEQDAAAPVDTASSAGQGGSLARFTIIGDFLYTLELDRLKWFALAADGSLAARGELELSAGKETIFPLDDLLFVGATDGLSIFQISADGSPTQLSEIRHFAACDPVVANVRYAYVTLRLESCAGIFRPTAAEDVLHIYDVQDLQNPTPIASYPMIDPRGLGLAGNVLFLCEGAAGLKVLDVTDPLAVTTIDFLANVHANDVIVLPESLLVIGPQAILQYDYSDPQRLKLLSTIAL
jgi:hypothetical protein